jgi:thiol-disulfide isomerase/thioredoxin
VSVAFFASYAVLWALVIFLSALVLLVYRHFGLQAMGTFEGVSRTGLRIGEEAPPVSGNSREGPGVTLWITPERTSLLVFVSSGCRPCEAIVPDLNLIASRLQTPDIAAITTNNDDLAAFDLKYLPQFPVLSDEGVGTARAFKVRATPFAFVIGTTGRVLGKAVISDRAKLITLLTAGGLEGWVDFLDREATTHVEWIDGPVAPAHRSVAQSDSRGSIEEVAIG